MEYTKTKKVSGLIYEPQREVAPTISEMIDDKKTQELISEVEASSCPEEVKKFLIEAAHRHTRFNYQNIAEFYCHQPKEVQELMEKSALVVVDLDHAIEYGFVKFDKRLQELRGGIEDQKELTILKGRK